MEMYGTWNGRFAAAVRRDALFVREAAGCCNSILMNAPTRRLVDGLTVARLSESDFQMVR
jgi:hypothetical protein